MENAALIIVVTYNSENFIEKCLFSIASQNFKNYFLLVIDNKSSDLTIERIKQYKNASHRVGVAGGMILDYSKNRISHLGGRIDFNFITTHVKAGNGINMENIISGRKDYQKPESYLINADYVTGALFATEVSLFKKLGGFDVGYRPAYFEELDYCLKIKRAGFKVLVNPLAFARHFEGASTGKFTKNFYYFYHKNRIRCAIINSGFLNILKIFFKSEILWLKSGAAKNYAMPMVRAYLFNWLFCPCYLIIKIINIIRIAGVKKIILNKGSIL